MIFSHGRESIVSLKNKFESGKYDFFLFYKEDRPLPGKKITDFKDIINNILEEGEYEIGYDYNSETIEKLREEYNKNPSVVLNYSWVYHNVEIVIHTDEKGEITTPEIIYWQEDESKNRSCYVVGMWEKDSEGWDLRFIGSRPFNIFEDDYSLDIGTLWDGIESCQKLLNAHFEVTRNV